MKLYTTNEAGAFLKRPPRTLKTYVGRGRLSPFPHDQLPEELRRVVRKGDHIFSEEELRRFKNAPRKTRSDAGKPKTRTLKVRERNAEIY